jgi:hypothetical protein
LAQSPREGYITTQDSVRLFYKVVESEANSKHIADPEALESISNSIK